MADDEMDTSVRVALRIRPQIPRELIDMCRMCTAVTPGEPQIILGTDKAFTFDYVFDVNSVQSEIYGSCVERLVEGALKGYNATVLAYGQTGSGKTYTMGTGFDTEINENVEGIIPRAVRHIFSGIEELKLNATGGGGRGGSNNENNDDGNDNNGGGGNGDSGDGVTTGRGIGEIQFSVAAQFMELYNEEIIDLLDPYNKNKMYKIHEDSLGGICVSGATIKPINGPSDALRCLQQGALARTTASTQMNAQSSRSHALFSILIRRQRIMSPEESGIDEGDLETLTSKFHFVDLAGSERLKRTGATGERAREGISINCGLLSLGNVISALGDKSKKASHVPYRDSKLTRLLQDSLGGNSQTLMIACISPSDRDFMETLNTLKYANRARNIKNRVQINQDHSSRTISALRREIAVLQLEILDYKQGKRGVDSDGNTAISDTFHENTMLLTDNKRLQQRIKAMQETINTLTERNVELLAEKATNNWNNPGTDKSITELIGGYLMEVEKLQAKLIESERMYQQLKKQTNNNTRNLVLRSIEDDPEKMIDMAKKTLEKERELLMSRSLPMCNDSSTSIGSGGSGGGTGLAGVLVTGTNCDNEQNIDDNESDSNSDSESEDNDGEMEAELNDLSSDIELKTKLIEQLELSQKRMQIMRQHYEDKLNVLNSKILSTQRERDQVISNLGGANTSSPSNDKLKKVRDEYERKLSDMQRELRKLQSAQKEHIRQQRELQAQDNQLRNLKNELYELKSAKVKLIRKIAEESSRHKETDARRTREISKLRKEARKQLNTIKSLQAQGAAKDQVLKRRTEQVTALRKGQQSKLSSKAAGRLPIKQVIPQALSSRQARIKWESVLRTISRAARSKQAVVELERELERLLQERDSLSKDLENVKRRQKSEPNNLDLASEEDTLGANINYIQENIIHVQHSIMELEEGGREQTSETQVLRNMIEEVNSIDEAKFLLEKLCNTAILQSCDIALSQNRLFEREAILNEVQQDSHMQQQLLQHVLSQNPNISSPSFYPAINNTNSNLLNSTVYTNLNIMQQQLQQHQQQQQQQQQLQQQPPYTLQREGTFDLSTAKDGDNNQKRSQSATSSRSTSPSSIPSTVLSYQPSSLQYEPNNANSILKTPKPRRKSVLPQELLAANENADKNEMTKSYTNQTLDVASKSLIPLARVPSAPGSLKGLLPIPASNRQKKNGSPLLPRKSFDIVSVTAPVSPRITRKTFLSNKNSPVLDDDNTPKTPLTFRRMISREENVDVFSRLGAGQQDPLPGGKIRISTEKMKPGIPLQCTYIVEGHTNSVLSVQVNENKLYTGAADRTVRIWDLDRGSGPLSLIPHPGAVVSVVYDKKSHLLFSACGSFVRVWDSRAGYSKAVKTLSSSGNVCSGSINPGLIQNGENALTALCMGASGNLYTAASDKVRIWDLRQYTCLGKLSGGHQAAVMCVTAWQGQNNTDFVATGSKDHYVKVFEVPQNGGTVLPLLNLEPPHYDGVQSLVVASNNNQSMGVDVPLFSGSRDSGIKRWDLRNGELKQSLNNAHKGWVSGMAISDNILLTACRGGFIRLWNVDSCDSIAEIKTDSPINNIVASDQLIYTGSNNGEVRIWRFTQPNLI